MSLYKIKEELKEKYDELIDLETGEINEDVYADIMQLTTEREEKLENTALYIKNQESDIKGLKNEKKKLEQRIKTKENSISYLKEILFNELKGEKFETPKAVVSFRKSEAVHVDDEFIKYAKTHGYLDLVNIKVTETANKSELKKLLKAGEKIQFCSLEEKQNIQIK